MQEGLRHAALNATVQPSGVPAYPPPAGSGVGVPSAGSPRRQSPAPRVRPARRRARGAKGRGGGQPEPPKSGVVSRVRDRVNE